jgi:hypothetical protein
MFLGALGMRWAIDIYQQVEVCNHLPGRAFNEIVFLDFGIGFLIFSISFQIGGNQTQRKRSAPNAQKKSR